MEMLNKGLKDVLVSDTKLSFIDGKAGLLIYRGVEAKKLALQHTFEEVAHLLWYGYLPNADELDQLQLRLKKGRALPASLKAILEALPVEMDLMSVLRTAVSSLGTPDHAWPPTVEEAIDLTAKLPTIIAYRYRKQLGLEPVDPNEDYTHVKNYLYMLRGTEPSSAHVKALESYMILTMEHGMNASTFTARVISSSESDLISAITGAIGTMKGPLHGGAPTGVLNMLDEIKVKENVEGWLRSKLSSGEKIMGFGHRVYKTKDPRAIALKEISSQIGGEDPWLDLANFLEQRAIELLEKYKPGRKLYTNVEFYAAAIMKAIGLDPSLFTPTFSASRIVGWTAHVLEQAEANTIYRPSANYIGELPANLIK
ncbi:citrate synthase/methylcitrate synthase [Pullulanibacillus sp. KACC 23026]|uniref:citrate synthase/methylcitrate synthase n=1 Tax=Pullulanibacillus sp. KACC 23026 TaxID=3028315 RepID=UPI0023B08951|nr:citrate synthase/methylcitrate synthase [Pullulanibacillus sp. KACC 23026]WEG14954.1 citrate synthase/methylcitrate synthase [Pullulanibacillus sp. KACC 23026]